MRCSGRVTSPHPAASDQPPGGVAAPPGGRIMRLQPCAAGGHSPGGHSRGGGSGALRSMRAAVLVYFVLLGLTEGMWVARIPGVKAGLHLTDGLLGASLLVGPAGLVAVMPLAGAGRPVRERPGDPALGGRRHGPVAFPVDRQHPALGADGGAGLRHRGGRAERGPEHPRCPGGRGVRAPADGFVPARYGPVNLVRGSGLLASAGLAAALAPTVRSARSSGSRPAGPGCPARFRSSCRARGTPILSARAARSRGWRAWATSAWSAARR